MTPCDCGMIHDGELDRMAHELADHIIETRCVEAAEDAVATAVADRIIPAIGGFKKAKSKRRRVNFTAYYQFLAPHEARLQRALKPYWKAQQASIVSHMRHSPRRAVGPGRIKALNFSELFEQWAFAKGPADKALQEIYQDFAGKLLMASAVREAENYGLSTSWDVFNQNIEGWLKTYSIDLADEINTTTLDKLKGSLLEGWQDGESIPDLTNRVRDLYEEFDRSRAETIARTESIRASNQGALAEYAASGVVDRVMWINGPDPCDDCLELDGKIADLYEDFHSDVGDVDAPPLHPRCVCDVVPILSGETVDEETGTISEGE